MFSATSVGSDFRADLEQATRVLLQHPAVREAAVTMRDDPAGQKQLVAYFTTPAERPATEELRAFCAQRLPELLVPAAYIALARLPLDRAGRVELSALPAIADAGESEALPLTRLESQMKKIWEEVLRVPAIGLHDDFFKLGGHSLLALQLFTRIEKTLGHQLPLSVLLQAPTIDGLLQVIRKNEPRAAGASLVEIQPRGSRRPMFWLHTLGGGGGAGLLTYHAIARHLGDDQPSYGFVAPEEPLPDLEAMAAHYIRELKAVDPVGPYHLGGYCFGGVVAYEMARQLRAAGAEVALVAAIESSPPNPPGRASKLSVDFLGHFFATLPRWLAAALRRPDVLAKKLLHRAGVRRKPHARAAVEAPAADPTADLLATVIDVSKYPEGFRRHAEAHWRAFFNYRPQPFDGCVTLIHTGNSSPFAYSPESDWRCVAREVKAHIIPGTHHNILADPQARRVAELLAPHLAAPRGVSRDTPPARWSQQMA